MSPAEYQRRITPLLNQTTTKALVQEIVLKDKEALKSEKINDFELGLRPNGEKIGQYHSFGYALDKNKQNPRAGFYNVDLILTGKTTSTLFLKPLASGFIFGWNDTHNLVGRYGLDILGLNQEWFDKRQKEVYRFQLIKEIKSKYKIA